LSALVVHISDMDDVYFKRSQEESHLQSDQGKGFVYSVIKSN